jgi:hypothetical protein
VLAALTFALTTMQTLFDNAATAILPGIVGPGALPAANARLMTGQALAGSFLGAPAAGALIAIALWWPFAVNAVTFVVAAALIASLPRSSSRPDARSGATVRADIADGLRRLWSDHLLRGICLANLLANTVIGGLTALLVLVVTRWAGASDTAFAFVLAAYAAGATGLGLAIFGACGVVFNVHAVTLMQQRMPTTFLGRVSAAQRTLGVAGAPIGALLAGALAEATEVNVPALAGAVLVALAARALARVRP